MINTTYKYIFCAIDIFPRKAYYVAMKNKRNDSVLNAIESIITFSNKPTVVISDSDIYFYQNNISSY